MPKANFRGAIAAAIVALSPALAQAQTASSPPSTPFPSPSPSASPLSTIATVSTAERATAPLASTAQTVYVVTKAKIEANGYQTVADALRDVPGITFFQHGAFGAEASFGTLGSLQSIVLLNGNPITAGSDGEVDLDTLSSNGVERIEVVESGGSTLYGSGGAGGIVNIITSVPNGVYGLTSYGSYGDRAVRVAAGNGAFGVTFERHVATNDYPYIAENGLPAGIRNNDEALQTALSLEYGQSFGNWNARASARLSSLDLGVPGAVQFAFGSSQLTPNAYDPSNRNDLSARIANESGKFATSLDVSGSRQALFDNNEGFGPEDAVVDARTNLELEEVDRQSDRDRLVAGIDLSRETLLDVLGAFGPPPSFGVAQAQAALYAQQAIGIGPSGKFYAGLRGENDTPAGSTLEPSAGFQLPAGQLRVGANVASSFIVPTLFDLYYPNFSNPDLLPERDRNINVIVSDPATFLNPRLTLFDRTANNLITTNANFTPVNAGTAHFQGAILSVAPKFGQTIVQLSVTDLPTAIQVANGAVGRVAFEPVLQGTLSIDHPFGGGNFAYGLTAKSVGAHTEGSLGPGSFGQYTTYNAYARGKLANDVVLTARIDDIGNEYYQMFNTYPVPARTYRIELSTR
jgi:vitamin B12 transporter